MSAPVVGTFTMTEEEWETAKKCVFGEPKARDRFWADLGKARGFDPTTADFTKPRVFTATLTRAARKEAAKTEPAPTRKTPPAAPVAPRTYSKKKQALEVDRLRSKHTEAQVVLPSEEQHTRVVVEDEDGRVAQIDQIDCARCGKNHHGITYRRLNRPVSFAGESLTHYAWCPTTGEPILLLIRDSDGDVRIPTDLARLLDEKGELVPAEVEVNA